MYLYSEISKLISFQKFNNFAHFFSKIFEKIIANRIIVFLDQNDVFMIINIRLSASRPYSAPLPQNDREWVHFFA